MSGDTHISLQTALHKQTVSLLSPYFSRVRLSEEKVHMSAIYLLCAVLDDFGVWLVLLHLQRPTIQ